MIDSGLRSRVCTGQNCGHAIHVYLDTESPQIRSGAFEAARPFAALTIKLETRGRKVLANSRDVAAMFEKQHNHVLRDIDQLLAAGAPPSNFGQGSYVLASTGKQQHRCYEMDRDGFTLLAMSFTGEKALKFKLAYIAEFNRMEDALRTPVRIISRDGEPWFVLADVCKVLDIQNPSDAAGRLDADEKSGVVINDPHGRPQQTTIISESGFYSMVLSSRKPDAKRFKKWVTSEVLPSIRKTGGYGNQSPMTRDRVVLDENISFLPRKSIGPRGRARVFGRTGTGRNAHRIDSKLAVIVRDRNENST